MRRRNKVGKRVHEIREILKVSKMIRECFSQRTKFLRENLEGSKGMSHVAMSEEHSRPREQHDSKQVCIGALGHRVIQRKKLEKESRSL